jgi:hypothetical protein
MHVLEDTLEQQLLPLLQDLDDKQECMPDYIE